MKTMKNHNLMEELFKEFFLQTLLSLTPYQGFSAALLRASLRPGP